MSETDAAAEGTVNNTPVETPSTDATTPATVTIDGRLCAAAPSLTATVAAAAAELE